MKLPCIAIVLCAASSVYAATRPLNAELAGIGFLVGRWDSDNGKVADTGGTSKGFSRVTVEANGAALLRRDHTDLFDAAKKPSGGFDQIMLVYPENRTIHADYSDGQHVIHYTSATVVAGESVTFSSVSQPDSPTFKLTYEFHAPDTLNVTFGMVPPGQSAFRPIASGTLKNIGSSPPISTTEVVANTVGAARG
jgi:hypothetical protein